MPFPFRGILFQYRLLPGKAAILFLSLARYGSGLFRFRNCRYAGYQSIAAQDLTDTVAQGQPLFQLRFRDAEGLGIHPRLWQQWGAEPPLGVDLEITDHAREEGLHRIV